MSFTCTNCGTSLTTGNRFCPNCGLAFDQAVPPAQAAHITPDCSPVMPSSPVPPAAKKTNSAWIVLLLVIGIPLIVGIGIMGLASASHHSQESMPVVQVSQQTPGTQPDRTQMGTPSSPSMTDAQASKSFKDLLASLHTPAPATTPSSTPPPVVASTVLAETGIMTADQLAQEYDDNGSAADSKYKGKPITVQGEISAVSDPDDAFPGGLVMLKTSVVTFGYYTHVVFCHLSADNRGQFNSLRPRQTLTVQGICQGNLAPGTTLRSDVIIDDCSVK